MKMDKRVKAGKIVIVILIVILLIAISMFALWLSLLRRAFRVDYVDDDLKLTSPDERHTLIIREWNDLLVSGAEIYVSKDGFGKMKLGRITTDYGCHPFHSGKYIVEWEENAVVLRFYSGSIRGQKKEDPETWETSRYILP